MQPYLDLLSNVIKYGVEKEDRTDTGTRSIFGWQMRYDLSKGFPLLTTKKLHFKSIAYELLWFIKGDTNIKFLNDNGISIWDEWADGKGELGPVYGKQWRSWPKINGGCIDQLLDSIKEIRNNPNSRRIIVSAWNPEFIKDMALPPCHCLFQFYVAKGRLSCQLYQRSADIFLGVPFNIASYALLTEMIAKVRKLNIGDFIITLGDAHLYNNHLGQAMKQIKRKTRLLPKLEINVRKEIEDYVYDDFKIVNYNPHPHISGKVAV